MEIPSLFRSANTMADDESMEFTVFSEEEKASKDDENVEGLNLERISTTSDYNDHHQDPDTYKIRYKRLTPQELDLFKRQETTKITGILEVDESTALKLLDFWSWNSDRLVKSYYEDYKRSWCVFKPR